METFANLVVNIMLIGVISVQQQLYKCPHSVNMHRLQFACFKFCVSIIRQRHVTKEQYLSY